MRQAASDGLDINAVNYVDCFTGGGEIGSGPWSPGGATPWDQLCALLAAVSGKAQVPRPVLDGAGPSRWLHGRPASPG